MQKTRLLGALCALAIAGHANQAAAFGGLLWGTPTEMHFNGDLIVSSVTVQVADGWLNSKAFSLEITIIGHRGAVHGQQIVHLNDDAAFDILDDGATAHITIPWTTDTNVRGEGENYTVCVQILVNGSPLDEPTCDPGIIGPGSL